MTGIPDLPDGLVPTLCAKGYFSELGRALAHIGEPEARFYRDLAGVTGVHTLRSVYADVHPETRHGVVITEDVIEAGGTFLDALSPYSPEQVAWSLEELARLHGATWGDAALASEPWLASRLQTYFEQRGEKEIRKNFEGPPGRDRPDALRPTVPQPPPSAFPRTGIEDLAAQGLALARKIVDRVEVRRGIAVERRLGEE